MIVIIPHQNDELSLFKLQKILTDKIYTLNQELNKNKLFYKINPLWIDITKISDIEKTENIKSELKNIAGIIKEVTLKHLIYENEQISILSEIITANKTRDKKNIFTISLPLIGLYKNKDNSYKEDEDYPKEIKKILSDFNGKLEIKLKIFRIGIAHRPSDNSFAISDSVWCKLK